MTTHGVLAGDCLLRLAELPDATVDAVVTDPPYGLEFMGKEWDRHPSPTAYQAWCEQWAAECLRLLKPGGHLLAFGGTRTWHRLTSGVEDAGFEMRESIAWLYAQGFPKSRDVGKDIDRAADAERPVVGAGRWAGREAAPSTTEDWRLRHERPRQDTAPATPEAERWQGWGTALKPAWEPIVVARKPFRGSVAANVVEHGTGALNIDASRIGTTERLSQGASRPGNNFDDDTYQWQGACNPQHPSGRWPANIAFIHGDGCQPVGVCKVRGSNGVRGAGGQTYEGRQDGSLNRNIGQEVGYADPDGTETIEAWDCEPGCPVAELDRQSGTLSTHGTDSGGQARAKRDGWGFRKGAQVGDAGGASRFYFCAKAPRSERVEVDGVRHPTVKPLALIRWLVRLVTPPDGLVLDPFLGSGTTAEAAILEGFRWVGCEQAPEYLPLIAKRVARGEDAVAGRLFTGVGG